MIADMPKSERRVRLFIMIAPGLLIIAGGVVAYLVAFFIPTFEFGRRRLLIATVSGLALGISGFVLHKKAVRDLVTVHRLYWKTVLFAVVSVFVSTAFTLLVADKAVGLHFSANSPTPILVLHPTSSDSYQTEEFTFTAVTNSFGIRDREVDLRRKKGCRILALGDSFTYGWGVADHEAWPKVLERRLAETKHTAEVLNFGCPGAGADAYAEIAENVIPISKPDFVLVAVLQGIDLKLLDLGKTADRLYQFTVDSKSRSGTSAMASLIPNTCALLARLAAHRPQIISAEETREQWISMTLWMPDRFTPDELERFNSLDSKVKQMFFDGNINPWEVYFAIKYPDYVTFTLRPERDDVQAAVHSMAGQLARIKQAAESSNARMVVLSVPPGWYFSPRALAAKRRVGYRLDETALRSDAPDDLIQTACQEAEVRFFSLSRRFRELGLGEKWFFDYDGMFDAEGHAIYGEEVYKVLSRLMD